MTQTLELSELSATRGKKKFLKSLKRMAAFHVMVFDKSICPEKSQLKGNRRFTARGSRAPTASDEGDRHVGGGTPRHKEGVPSRPHPLGRRRGGPRAHALCSPARGLRQGTGGSPAVRARGTPGKALAELCKDAASHLPWDPSTAFLLLGRERWKPKGYK